MAAANIQSRCAELIDPGDRIRDKLLVSPTGAGDLNAHCQGHPRVFRAPTA